MIEYGLQLFSVRDAIGQDFAGTMKKIADIGYSSVELACCFGYTSELISTSVKDAGLTVSGAHLGIEWLDRKYDHITKYLKDMNCYDYIVPYIEWNNETFYANIEKINKYQPILEADGFHLLFHNHANEFTFVNSDGITPMEALIKETDVELEVDTFWVFAGGKNPVEFITEHKNRISRVHIKDGYRNGEGEVIGRGEAPVIASRNAALDLGFKLIVESENQRPDGITEITEGFKYLTSN